jgi:hypothetical protein
MAAETSLTDLAPYKNPLLLIAGSVDTTVDPMTSRKVVPAVQSLDVTLRIIPGADHIYLVLDKDQTLANRCISITVAWWVQGEEMPADPVELADVAPAEAAQERAEGGRRLDRVTEDPRRPAGPQGVGVVDAVTAGERRGDERKQLVADVRPTDHLPEVQVRLDELAQAEMGGERGRQEEPGVGHQAIVVEGRIQPVEAVRRSHLSGVLLFGSVVAQQPHRPSSEGHLFASPDSRISPGHRWIRANLPGAKFDGATGRYLFGQLCLAAQLQRDLDSERMTGMQRRLFEDGRHRGHDPLGYRSLRDATGNLVHPRQLAIVPDGAAVVRRVSNELAQRSLVEVAELMNREGMPHRERGVWTRESVKDIPRRGRMYLGFVVEKRGRDERPGRHEPILTEAEYHRTIAAIASRGRVGSRASRTACCRRLSSTLLGPSCGSASRPPRSRSPVASAPGWLLGLSN